MKDADGTQVLGERLLTLLPNQSFQALPLSMILTNSSTIPEIISIEIANGDRTIIQDVWIQGYKKRNLY